jgi:hypothetical protein
MVGDRRDLGPQEQLKMAKMEMFAMFRDDLTPEFKIDLGTLSLKRSFDISSRCALAFGPLTSVECPASNPHLAQDLRQG